jgi:hypothetical protein
MTPTPFQQQLTGLYRKQHILGVLLFSLVTIVVWVSISLITSQRKTSISPELQKLAKPLTPTLNLEVVEQIEAKKKYSESELASFPIYRTLSSTDNRAQATAAPISQTSSLGTLTGASEASSAATTATVSEEETESSAPATSSATIENTGTSEDSGEEL